MKFSTMAETPLENGQTFFGTNGQGWAIGQTGGKELIMIKLKFFVHCSGWADGGYENTIYFYKRCQGPLLVKSKATL